MMQTIYKYPIFAEDYFELDLPQDAQVLTVQLQYGEPQMWVLVNPDRPTEKRKFRLAGTGHPINESNIRYINTFILQGGVLVFHLFEILPLLIEHRPDNT